MSEAAILNGIDYIPIRPEDGLAHIHVPQAHYAIAAGPVCNVGILSTRVAQCVAVALVGPAGNDGLPKIVLGHVDDAGPVAVSMKTLIDNFGTHPKDVQAYVVTGDRERKLYDGVLNALYRAAIPVLAEAHESYVADLAVELTTGFPVAPESLQDLAKYRPTKKREASYEEFVFGERARFNGRGAFLAPLRLAFDLRKGIPPEHIQIAPAAKAVANDMHPK